MDQAPSGGRPERVSLNLFGCSPSLSKQRLRGGAMNTNRLTSLTDGIADARTHTRLEALVG